VLDPGVIWNEGIHRRSFFQLVTRYKITVKKTIFGGYEIQSKIRNSKILKLVLATPPIQSSVAFWGRWEAQGEGAPAVIAWAHVAHIRHYKTRINRLIISLKWHSSLHLDTLKAGGIMHHLHMHKPGKSSFKLAYLTYGT
jgi:hypothetical protein